MTYSMYLSKPVSLSMTLKITFPSLLLDSLLHFLCFSLLIPLLLYFLMFPLSHQKWSIKSLTVILYAPSKVVAVSFENVSFIAHFVITLVYLIYVSLMMCFLYQIQALGFPNRGISLLEMNSPLLFLLSLALKAVQMVGFWGQLSQGSSGYL